MNTATPLRITEFHFFPIKLDFHFGVTHSLASRHHSDNIIVELEAESGHCAFGEGLPRSYVTGETPASVLTALYAFRPDVDGAVFNNPRELHTFLISIGVSEHGMANPSAVCALELALIDLAGKHWGIAASELLGLSTHDHTLRYSLVIPLIPENELSAFLDQAKDYHFHGVKVKIDNDIHIEQVCAVRDILGPDIEIRVDANCSWDPQKAQDIVWELSRLGVVSVEQPFAADSLESNAAIRALRVMDVTLDESILNYRDVDSIAEAGACDVINVRISKCGGILGALRVIKAARANDLAVQMGAQVGESCILSSAGLLLASVVDDFRWLEGCFGRHLLSDDLCEENIRFGYGGIAEALTGNGLGVEIDPDRLASARDCYIPAEKDADIVS